MSEIPDQYKIKRLDHTGILVRNVDEAEPWWTEVLGAVPFERVGYEDGGKIVMKSPYRHLFLNVGGQRVELVEAPDWRGFPREGDYSMSPHYAFAVSAEALDWYIDRFTTLGVKFQGPIYHPPLPVASIYFTDADSNHLELAAWEGYDVSKCKTEYVRWDDLHHDKIPSRPAHLAEGQFAGQ